MRQAVIVSAARTAVGKFGGSLTAIHASELAALAIAEVIKRAGIQSDSVDEVILGNVLQAGLGQNPARQAAVKAGIPYEVPAVTINKVCASSLKSIGLAVQAIINGDAEIIVAGGMENMSAAPYLLNNARWGYRMNNDTLVDQMIKDGLWCAFYDVHMGITAENVAEKYGVTREEQDLFALESQKKAVGAIDQGFFKDEIIPVPILQKKGEPLLFETDEFPRRDISFEKLSRLAPAFKQGGTVTAGNSSGINDGAAAVLVMSEDKARELGIKPMAVIRSFASAGVDPAFMGMGPVPSCKKAMAKAGLNVSDLNLIEISEAFAALAVALLRELDLPPEKVNVNGGAIPIGHPIGASGARLLVTMLYELKRRKETYGMASLCIGGGQGASMIVENIN